MARFLKENTATRVTVGPFIDVADGFTPEIALTVTSELLTFVVDDAGVPTLVIDAAPTASGGSNDMVHITSDAAGFYDLELTAAQTNYTGRAILSLNNLAVHLPVWHEFQIVSANVYDSLFTDGDVLDVSTIQFNGGAVPTPAVTGVPDVNITHIGDGAVPAPAVTGVPDVNVTHAADTAWGSGAITTATFGSGAINAAALAADAATEIAQATLPKTNTALTDVPFMMVLSSDHVSPATGLAGTIAVSRCIDGATAFTSIATPNVAEIANGMYNFDIPQTDTNGTLVTYRFSVATADDTFLTIRFV